MSNSSEFDIPQPSLQKLTVRLLIVLVCSILPPIGFITTIFSQGLVVFGAGGGKMQPTLFVQGIIITAMGPIILGIFLKPVWRGLFAGLLGASWIFIFLLYNLDRIPIVKIVPENFSIEFVPYNLTFIPKLFAFNNTIEFALITGGTILIVLTTSRYIKRPIGLAGLILGLLIGFLLEFFILHLPTYWGGGGSGIFTPYVWISAVFFSEFTGKQENRRLVLVWLAFVFTSLLMLMIIEVMFRIKL